MLKSRIPCYMDYTNTLSCYVGLSSFSDAAPFWEWYH